MPVNCDGWETQRFHVPSFSVTTRLLLFEPMPIEAGFPVCFSFISFSDGNVIRADARLKNQMHWIHHVVEHLISFWINDKHLLCPSQGFACEHAIKICKKNQTIVLTALWLHHVNASGQRHIFRLQQAAVTKHTHHLLFHLLAFLLEDNCHKIDLLETPAFSCILTHCACQCCCVASMCFVITIFFWLINQHLSALFPNAVWCGWHW